MCRTKGALVKNPTKGTARGRAWHSMRILRSFTLPDLVKTADIGLNNVTRYVAALTRHGYVRADAKWRGGRPGDFRRYTLVRDTGPSHPLACSACGGSILKRKKCELEGGSDDVQDARISREPGGRER